MVKYHTDTKKYYLRDLADGTGTFIKIVRPTKIESGNIISFGDTHMTILIEKENNLIILKFLEGMRANEKKSFSIDSLPITVGREESNTIVMNSINMSKRHCKYR
jgi:pSer/pThr/pTyr-binding forkhead associated (FHA) protein